MATYQYPQTVYDLSRSLMTTLGSMWADLYVGKDQILSYVLAKGQIETQSMLDMMELIASLSRYEVPIYHKDNWYVLTLLESERNDAQTSLVRYDGTENYDAGHRYDVPFERDNHAFPIISTLKKTGLIMNRFIEPTVLWVEGLDYQLDPVSSAIIFRTNPFKYARIPKRPVYVGGVVTDYAVDLWIFRGDFEWSHAYRQFGYVLGLKLASSPGYRDLMNAIFDGIVGGTTRRAITNALAATTGIPLVMEQEETVEIIDRDHTHRLIVTDQHVYKFHVDATPLVVVGDIVRAGDSLTDSLVVDEFNRGITPDDLEMLAMGRGFLSSCFYGDLIFEDKDVALVVDSDHDSGYTKVTFALGGFPLDVEHFFTELHTRGIAQAALPVDDCEELETITIPGDPCADPPIETRTIRRGTLAHLLDRRETRVGEPEAASLPSTINPLQFLIQYVLRNNAFLVRVRASQLGSDAIGMHNLRMFRKIVPPHTAMILLLELTAKHDSVTIDMVKESTMTVDYGAEPLKDTVPASQVGDNRMTARIVSGTCQ